MYKKTLIYVMSLAILGACQQMGKSGETALNISAPEGKELIIYQLNPQSADPLDTLTAGTEKITYGLNLDTSNLFMVNIPDGIRIPLYVAPGDQLELEISQNGDELDYRVEGSAESQRIKKITDIVDSSKAVIDAMAQQMQSGEGAVGQQQEFQEKFEAQVEQTRSKLLAMIDEEPGRISNLFIWPQSVGRFQLVPADEYIEYYEKVAAALQEEMPENPHVPFFADQVEKIKSQIARAEQMEKTSQNIAVGEMAPDISLPDTTGEIHKLSELRGKVVLVDFWASWCRPCRQENPTLVKTYKQYKDEGFTVYSVSLDGMRQQPNARAAWLQAIEQDKLSWPHHVSDLKAWQSPVVDQYGFQGIPFTVLIDEDGKILGKNLRGPALGKKLAEVFGKG